MKAYLSSTALVLTVFAVVGCDKVLFGERTTYAENFSERKFAKLAIGMSVIEVTNLLGSPLSQFTQECSEVWCYFPPSPPESTNADGTMTFNLFGPVTNLRVSETGSIESVSGDYLTGDFVGLTTNQIKAKIGLPNRLERQERQVIFSYSEANPKGSGTYKMRTIHFDKFGKVQKTVKAVHYD